MTNLESAIYIVATPIGNLGDISQRAIEVLGNADLIAAEDTRHTKKLLSHLGIQKEMLSLHEHNERERVDQLVGLVNQGKSVALVSDAGTPLISDPGYVLVSQARAQGVKVLPVPGACALIAALSASGVASARFSFEGFLPVKQKAKREQLAALVDEQRTTIFYESTHRIMDTMKALCDELPARNICLARELTKTFETFLVGTVEDVLSSLNEDENQRRGEFVLLVEGVQESDASSEITPEARALLLSLAKEVPPKKAASLVAEHYALNKKDLYKLLVEN
ncbi:rRNA (cytidine-2'-O-)-methyltransferase [Oleiphilus sp. HI0125]|nr:rRNA (cytidine-2'-O-)-methyltransferase [Oleiphilus sp. HI0125]KZZ60757.1 rRNA (cytidine-2'-O-)-methyltransferase [Oleiphilus sp. HI0125]